MNRSYVNYLGKRYRYLGNGLIFVIGAAKMIFFKKQPRFPFENRNIKLGNLII